MSDLLKQLMDLGYTESQANSIATKSRVYFQENVDDITNKARETTTKNVENRFKDYIPKNEYDAIQLEYSKLKSEIRTNEIKSQFLKLGGKEQYFNDYLNLNKNLMEIDTKELDKTMSNTTKSHTWAFNGTVATESDFGKSDKPSESVNLYDYSRYEKI